MIDGRLTPQPAKPGIITGIRTILLERGSATKAELSRSLRISFPTAGKFLDEMEARGEAVSVGYDESSGGRRAKRYRYDAGYMLGLAVFLEKDETRYILFNCLGETIEQGGADGFLDEDASRLTDLIERLRLAHPKLRSVSLGVPGAVNDGKIFLIPTYEKYRNFDLKSFVQERTGLPAVVENDMNAAVLGYIARAKPGDGCTAVYLYLGQNGPGAGIVVNGEVVRGKSFFSGEVSFVPVRDRGNFGEALSKGDADRTEAIGRLVASTASILNPHYFIFNKDEIGEAMLEPILERAAAYVPREHLPKLAASEWRGDYLAGLRSLGLGLLLSQTDG
ncbi:ROK family protein [Cohnella cellulosilytica]|uniref:ROK family protein n=1 Tax=Cohnella cellulosilytica TaxID=986710 RepID=A0ABW2F5K5_9BACL